MADIYIRQSYLSIERPFTLSRRDYNGVEVNWYRIAFLHEEDAKHLAGLGVPWFGDEPDWDKHHQTISEMIERQRIKDAQAEIASAEQRLSQISPANT